MDKINITTAIGPHLTGTEDMPLVSAQDKAEMSQELVEIAMSHGNLQNLTAGTGIELAPADLLDPNKRAQLATCLTRKAIGPYSSNGRGMDGEDIDFALQALVNTALIHELDGFNPEVDDACLLAMLSGIVVQSFKEGTNIEDTSQEAISQLLKFVSEHALDLVLDQVKSLLHSEDDTHKEIAQQVLRLLTNKFINVPTPAQISAQKVQIQLDGGNVKRELEKIYYVLNQMKKIAKMKPKAIRSAIMNEDSIGQVISGHLLLASVITGDSPTTQELKIIKFICRNMGRQADLTVIENLQGELIPAAKHKRVAEASIANIKAKVDVAMASDEKETVASDKPKDPQSAQTTPNIGSADDYDF